MGFKVASFYFLYLKKIVLSLKWWPHIFFMICYCVISFFTDEEERTYVITTFIEYYTLVISLMIVLYVLNHCHNENTKNKLLVLSNFPISGTLRITIAYIASITYFLLFYLLILCIVFFDVNLSEQYMKRYSQITYEEKVYDNIKVLRPYEKVGEGEHYAIKAIFTQRDFVSSVSSEMWPFANIKNNQTLKIKSKRITDIKTDLQNLQFANTFNTYNGKVFLKIIEFYKVTYDRQYFQSLANALMSNFTKVALLILLAFLLGTKFSFETVLFSFISLFMLKYLIQTMGVEIINEFIKGFEDYVEKTSNFSTLWWERPMMHWAKFISYFQAKIALHLSVDEFLLLKERKWVQFPLSELKIYFFIFIGFISLFPFVQKKEVI